MKINNILLTLINSLAGNRSKYAAKEYVRLQYGCIYLYSLHKNFALDIKFPTLRNLYKINRLNISLKSYKSLPLGHR